VFLRLAKTVYVGKRHSNVTDFCGGETLIDKKLELVFVDREGKFYPLDEVSAQELAKGLEKISKETAKRLQLQKDQR
jgi:hypothetical protein